MGPFLCVVGLLRFRVPHPLDTMTDPAAGRIRRTLWMFGRRVRDPISRGIIENGRRAGGLGDHGGPLPLQVPPMPMTIPLSTPCYSASQSPFNSNLVSRLLSQGPMTITPIVENLARGACFLCTLYLSHAHKSPSCSCWLPLLAYIHRRPVMRLVRFVLAAGITLDLR